jgi:hypothetical protein
MWGGNWFCDFRRVEKFVIHLAVTSPPSGLHLEPRGAIIFSAAAKEILGAAICHNSRCATLSDVALQSKWRSRIFDMNAVPNSL